MIKHHLNKKLYDVTYADVIVQSTTMTRIADHVEMSDDMEDISPIIAFYVPFFENDRTEINTIIKELTSKMFVCGYNIASTEEFNVEKQPFDDEMIAIMHI